MIFAADGRMLPTPFAGPSAVDLSMSSFLPTSIAGCLLWLRADLGVTLGVGVAAWADQSGNGHNVTQPVGTHQPTLNASDAAYAGQSTLSCLRSAVQYLQSASFSIPQVHTAVAVCNYDGASSNQAILDGLAEFVLLETNENVGGGPDIYAGVTLQAGVALSAAPMVIIGEYNTATSKIYVSANTAQATGAVGSATPTGITIGAEFGGGAGLNGKVAEVILYSGIVGATDRSNLLTYIGGRYGIAIGP